MDRGTLAPGEAHPAAAYAAGFVKALGIENLVTLQGAMSSCAIEGNRAAEICGETLRRLMAGKPVSDRYVLGLAWFTAMELKRQEKD